MTANLKYTNASSRDLDTYLATDGISNRLALLEKWRKTGVTLDYHFVRGIIDLRASHAEIVAAFDVCSTVSKPEFELWVMNNLLTWHQNIADLALRTWARITDCVLWHRLLPLVQIANPPQRILFTILDIGAGSHGFEITKAILNSPNWEELSQTFHALLIERSLQYSFKSERITKLAKSILDTQKQNHRPESKALIPALCWLCCHAEKDLKTWLAQSPQTMWRDVAKQILETHMERSSTFSKLEKIIAKGERSIDFSAKLPSFWSRREASAAVCRSVVKDSCHDGNLLSGFSTDQIILGTEKDLFHPTWAPILISFLPISHGAQIASHGGSAPSNDTTELTPPSYNNFSISYDGRQFPELAAARLMACDGKLGFATDRVQSAADFSADDSKASVQLTHPIRNFLNAFSGNQNTSAPSDGVWHELANASLNPSGIDLESLGATARKYKGLVSLAYINVLARMVGRDDAVLKLLDYIRGNEESELCAIVRALGQINTPRSILELIAMLTRPNATILVQQEIVGVLTGKDLGRLQTELRSAIHDLVLPLDLNHPICQLKEDLSNLLPQAGSLNKNIDQGQKISPLATTTDAEGSLDLELKNMIPHYKDLSSEVKRALRTALFFNRTVTDSPHANSIDLSPLIDMQYKAMELLYREFFEGAVSQSLNSGSIQRKLDVIGYARPIERQMDEFESYVAALPVVKTIPFFSKFKMRKTLRAICMFQPGRRFTLDGLKAFGIYFLVFGRQECKHGLANSFSMGSKNDLELAEFCKELHIFQDFRNRAAHEGFHPDASNDILGIWRTTASVVQWAFKIRESQGSSAVTARNKAS